MANKRVDEPTGTETVGHEWDGIEELNTPLPRWWLWTFYATIVFAIGYVIAYPALPMLHAATPGVLGWTSRGQLSHELAEERHHKDRSFHELAHLPIERLPENEQRMRMAVAGGRAARRIDRRNPVGAHPGATAFREESGRAQVRSYKTRRQRSAALIFSSASAPGLSSPAPSELSGASTVLRWPCRSPAPAST